MSKLVLFKDQQIELQLKKDSEHHTVWATQKQIAEIFSTTKQNVSLHIDNIIKEEELDNSVVKDYLTTASDGKKYKTKHYNLDMIIAVGYRINSKKATQFRQWATGVIREFATTGFVVDNNRASPNELAKRLRKLRNEEKSFYAMIRNVFKESASDYDVAPKDQKQKFFAICQDKFLFAITGKTSAQIITERCDHSKDNMGLVNFASEKILTKDIVIGKNYLDQKELEELEILCENFLGFCHLKAFREEIMTFDELTYKVNAFLEFNGYQCFRKYDNTPPFRKDANEHAKREYKLFKQSNTLLSSTDK